MGARERNFRRLCVRFQKYRDIVRQHAARELDYQVALGLLDEAVLSPDDVLDEAVLEAWKQRARRPAHVSDREWFCYAVRCALARLARQARPMFTAASLDEQILDPELDDQLWAFWEPDDVSTLEDVVPDEDCPVVEEAALRDIEVELVSTLLPTLPTLEREAFQFHLVEGRSLEEVAKHLDTSPEVVAHAAEVARTTLLDRLGHD